MVESSLPEVRCQFCISPSALAVVRMLRVLKLLFSGRQRMYEKGVLFSLEMVYDRHFFFTLNTLTVPFSHAT